MSAKDIFREVERAIKAHQPDLWVRDHVNQEVFEHILKCLRHRANYFEKYSFQ